MLSILTKIIFKCYSVTMIIYNVLITVRQVCFFAFAYCKKTTSEVMIIKY